MRWRRGRGPAVNIVGGNAVDLLHDPAECLPAMLEAIEAAEREILIEMYWFGSDRTGHRFAEALSERAREGVPVYVIYDAVGSFEADVAMFEQMRGAGCHVHEFHPLAPWRRRFRIGRINDRDHRKLLVVDGWIVLTGGVNIGDPWASSSDGGSGWRDDVIRIEGPAAAQAREVFAATWNDLGREHLGSLPHGELQSASEPQRRERSGSTMPGRSRVRIVANDYRGQRRAILDTYLHEIGRAERWLDISNSYFVPDRDVRRALTEAAGRGVRVRVLVPGESDVPPVQLAGERLYAWLMERGIELYKFHGPVLHTKSAVIDERWCTVGTFNLDYRSFRSNLEVNAVVEDGRVAAAMHRRFEDDLRKAVRIDPHDWAYRPLSQRALELFFYMFRKLL